MAVFSTLRSKLLSNATNLFRVKRTPDTFIGPLMKRQMGGHGGHVMKIETTDFSFKKAVDVFHWYTCVAAVLYGSIILYCNVFIGDGELREIPEGYVPKYWEYYEHPIQRFIAWMHGDPQKAYENMLHHIYHNHWDWELTKLDDKVKFEMKKHKDYKAYYYRAISANSLRVLRQESLGDEVRVGMHSNLETFPNDFKDEDDWPIKLSDARVVVASNLEAPDVREALTYTRRVARPGVVGPATNYS